MKAIFSLIGILFITGINAQKFDCSSKTTAYQELFTVKDISGAFDTWSEVRKNCPAHSETIYTDGINILQYKIDNADDKEREILVRDLLKLYDQYNKNFPASTVDFEVSKAMALYDNKIEANDEILNLLNSGFAKASESITDASAIFTYFRLAYEKFKAGDSKYNADFVVDKYALTNSMLARLQTTNPSKAADYTAAERSIHSLAKDLATCDNLAAYYEKNYSEHQEDTAWIAAALTSLSAKCSAKPVFNTMAQNLYAAKVSSQSAYFMALANLKQRKFEDAIKFYNEAAELETNPQEKAKLYYNLATGLLASDMEKSKEAIHKALQADPKMAKAYLYLAQAYTNANSVNCGKTDFEKKAIYYLAIETARKAGTIDAKLKPAGDKMAKDYASKTLTQSEINKQKMNGKSLTIGCWINETITFPSK